MRWSMSKDNIGAVISSVLVGLASGAFMYAWLHDWTYTAWAFAGGFVLGIMVTFYFINNEDE